VFHSVGKGLGRGRGPRLAEVAVPKKEQSVEIREKIEVQHGTLASI
jgi:hypothetical protein